MKTLLKTNYREKIPLSRLNPLKRSTYQNAYNQAGDKVIDDVEFYIGDLFKTAIEKATKGLKITGKSTKGKTYLATAIDPVKDQTDFLAQINHLQVSKLLFPLGRLMKNEVRDLALKAGLPSSTIS